MEKHLRILVVLPHPDDETFGVGGTIAMHAKAGARITYACATLGQMGRNMGKPFFANRETLPILRESELREACKVLGIEDLRLLGLRDKTVEFENRQELAERILKLIDEIRPTLIITHYPGHGVHPDHNACGAATVLAVSMMPENERPVVYGHAISKNREEALGKADIIVDITEVLDVKLAAIRAHRSQSEAMMSGLMKQLGAVSKPADLVPPELKKEIFWTIRS